MTGGAEYEVVSRRPTHRARKFWTAVEKVRFRDGREVTREVIHHPGAAVLLPLLPDGRVLLVRVWRHAAGAWMLEVPAGTLEAGEPPAECARRELREETGFVAGTLRPLASWYPSPGILDETMHLFLATDLREESRHPEEDELVEPHPVAPAEAARMVADGRIRDGKTLLALFLGGLVAALPAQGSGR